MTAGRQRDVLGSMIAWLAHPVSIGALVLLVVNDHVLKTVWPGFVTGKLSDLAGMVMFPPLLATALALVAPRLPSRGLALGTVIATGTVFTTIKSSGYAVSLAERTWSVLSGQPVTIAADPTDLLAVPFVALAFWAWHRSSPFAAGTSKAVRAAVLVPVGLLATMATSPANYQVALTVFENDGIVYVGYDSVREGAAAKVTSHLLSRDNGLTFTYVKDQETVPAGRTSTQGCVNASCYRVVPGELLVQQSADAGRTWTTAWQITGWEYEALRHDRDGITNPRAELSSQSLAVIATTPGRHIVIAANGRDGLLRKAEDGSWARIGFDGSGRVTPLRSAPDFTSLRAVAIVLVFAAAFYAWILTVAVNGPPSRRRVSFLILAISATVVNLFYLLPSQLPVYSWILLALLHAGALATGIGLVRERLLWTAIPLVLAAPFAWWATTISLSPGPDLEFIVIELGSTFSEAVQHLSLALPALVAVILSFLAGLFLHRPAKSAKPPAPAADAPPPAES